MLQKIQSSNDSKKGESLVKRIVLKSRMQKQKKSIDLHMHTKYIKFTL